MSLVEIAHAVQGQQAPTGFVTRAPRERAEPSPAPRASPGPTDGQMPALSARLSRLALAQRQHHQGWR